MKNIFKSTVIIILILSLFAGCSQKTNNTPVEKEPWDAPSHFYGYYKDVDSFIEEADFIGIGRITDIFFKILDTRTWAVAEDNATFGNTDIDSFFLFTIYEVEIEKTYKGEESEKIYFRMPCGIREYREAEQYAEMKRCGITNKQIPIDADDIFFEKGVRRMFALCGADLEYMYIINPIQSVLSTHVKDNNSENPDEVNYYNIINRIDPPVSTDITADNANKIKPGMKYSEIIDILGVPGTDVGSGAILYEGQISEEEDLYVWFDGSTSIDEIIPDDLVSTAVEISAKR